ncbi:MAG: hypothetical protein AAF991_01645 [Pseudomonadota bacterium]
MTTSTAVDALYATSKKRHRASSTFKNTANAVAITVAAMALTLGALNAQAEITQDCILEGTVDLRAAERMGQPTYVKFKRAQRGESAGCSINRKSSRRVKFISNPDPREIQHVSHGSTVRYRYLEHDRQQGRWELIEIIDNRSI